MKVAYDLRDEAAPAPPATLSEEEVLERLKRDFDAQEIDEGETA